MTALRLGSALYTLVLAGTEAVLWDAEGQVLGTLPAEQSGPARRKRWASALAGLLPREAKVQFLVKDGELEIECQEAPYLSPRECQEVVNRLAQADSAASPADRSFALDADPLAEGGHRLWIAQQDRGLMQDGTGAVLAVGAVPVFATAWQRAFQAALPEGADTRLFLALEPGLGRILLFEGRGLLLTRVFRLPEDIHPAEPDEDSLELLTELLVEEVARTLQYLKQKFRGLTVRELEVAGLGALPAAAEERFRRAMNLGVKLFAPSLEAYLLMGLLKERERKSTLNLLPVEIQDALKLRVLRSTVWSSVALIMLGLLGAQYLLSRETRALERGVIEAREGRAQRARFMAEADQAAQARSGILRVGMAEKDQTLRAERIEALGLTLFQVPEGVSLEKASLLQLPGEPLRFRVEVEGVALTRKEFSVGPLAEYLARLNAQPGLQLEPLQEVSVSDRLSLSGNTNLVPKEHAVTRFRLAGVAQ